MTEVPTLYRMASGKAEYDAEHTPDATFIDLRRVLPDTIRLRFVLRQSNLPFCCRDGRLAEFAGVGRSNNVICYCGVGISRWICLYCSSSGLSFWISKMVRWANAPETRHCRWRPIKDLFGLIPSGSDFRNSVDNWGSTMRQIVIGLLILFSTLLTLIAFAFADAPQKAADEGQLTIQQIEVDVIRSVPPKIFARVHGVTLNGCTDLGEIVQHRANHTIMVKIPTIVHQQVCTMMARLIDKTIQLQGDFAPGVYTIDVNGIVQQFKV
jgi:hypothetical protein